MFPQCLVYPPVHSSLLFKKESCDKKLIETNLVYNAFVINSLFLKFGAPVHLLVFSDFHF